MLVHLTGSFDLILGRMEEREHFMKPDMLQSQFATLEPPTNALTIDITRPVSDVVAAARRVIDPDRLIVVVTGDRRILEPALRAANLGPIVVVDADGRAKP